MFRKVKRLIKTRKFERKMFYYAKQYLGRGTYYFDYQYGELRKLDHIFSRQLLHAHFKVSSHNPINIVTGGDIKIIKARSKYVMLINDIAYTIPYSIHWYNHIKKKYLNYSYIFNYPHAKLISFDDKRHVLLIERINGSVFNDIKHHKQIIQKMIEYALESPVLIKQYKYLQHGDVNPGNVLWIKSRTPVFIDLDNLDYHIFLFDIVHYSSGCISAKQLVSILDENTDAINQLFNRFGMEYNRHYLDCVFAEYVEWYFHYCPEFKGDYQFLRVLNIEEFRKTLQLILSN